MRYSHFSGSRRTERAKQTPLRTRDVIPFVVGEPCAIESIMTGPLDLKRLRSFASDDIEK
jgi:hypothetical protein